MARSVTFVVATIAIFALLCTLAFAENRGPAPFPTKSTALPNPSTTRRPHHPEANQNVMYVGGVPVPYDPEVPPLYQYIDAFDPYFRWSELKGSVRSDKFQADIFYLTFNSQMWLTPAETTVPVWSHNLTLIRPWNQDDALKNAAALYITGGDFDSIEEYMDSQVEQWGPIIKSGVAVAILTNIPNQPMRFIVDPADAPGTARTEDEIVAPSWRKVMEYPNRPDYNVYFAMAKASSRALDVLEQWSAKKLTVPYSRFYLFGASKRGATTWLTTLYEAHKVVPRIFAAAPLVYDLLNTADVVRSMTAVLGEFTWAFYDYAQPDAAIPAHLGNDTALGYLTKHIDPLTPWYSKAFSRVPKLILNCMNDQFFIPTNDHYYWDDVKDLQSTRFLTPNSNHSMQPQQALVNDVIAAHLASTVRGITVKKIDQIFDYETNTLTLKTVNKPVNVTVWRGVTLPNDVSRLDFRYERWINSETGKCPDGSAATGPYCNNWVQFEPIDISANGKWNWADYSYTYSYTESDFPTDGSGYVAFYMIVQFENQQTQLIDYTSTSAMFLPNQLHFTSCYDSGDCAQRGLV